MLIMLAFAFAFVLFILAGNYPFDIGGASSSHGATGRRSTPLRGC